MNHKNKVENIAKKIADAEGKLVLGRDITFCSRSFDYKKGKTPIDISELNEILEINMEENTIVVEPLVTMAEVVGEALKFKRILPVAAEFKNITVGGAILGLGAESSSHRFGLFDEAVVEYEMICGNGTIIEVHRHLHENLFYALPGSLGALGIITKIKLKLVSSAHYVRVEYKRLQSIDDVMLEFKNTQADFIECVAIAQNDFRIASGIKTDDCSLKDRLLHSCSLKHFFSPWYYFHLRDKSIKDFSYEYLTYEDYLFRWNRGAFWFSLNGRQHTLLNRILFGRKMSHNYYNVYKQRPLLAREASFICQDIMIPLKNGADFYSYLNDSMALYPLWLIPIKPPLEKKIFSLSNIQDIYVNFGIWSQWPPKIRKNFFELHRNLEECLQEKKGRKTLYGQCYSSREEFWQIYDRIEYERLRKQYHAEDKFVDIYDKVSEAYSEIITLYLGQ